MVQFYPPLVLQRVTGHGKKGLISFNSVNRIFYRCSRLHSSHINPRPIQRKMFRSWRSFASGTASVPASSQVARQQSDMNRILWWSGVVVITTASFEWSTNLFTRGRASRGYHFLTDFIITPLMRHFLDPESKPLSSLSPISVCVLTGCFRILVRFVRSCSSCSDSLRSIWNGPNAS
jgi:hypothetical protein